tara:strand:- start:183 stop:449 length:267 start_codon:yes stop_codon:yes gene_type:complete
MSPKGKNDPESLERLMKSLKIKLTKLTKGRGEFVDCMAKFSLIFMRSCEDLTETTGLLIAIIDQIELKKGELNSQQIDYLRRCLQEDT